MNYLDGKKLRDEMLADLKAKVSNIENKPTLAAVLVGEDAVSIHYVDLKKKICEKIGAKFVLHKYKADISEDYLINKIDELNNDPEITGIMIQIPLPDHMDKFEVVNAIASEKDIDGLRFCGGFKSCFIPPVVQAVLKAVELSGKRIEESEMLIIGRGFLVGWPLAQCLEEAVKGLVIADKETKNLIEISKTADILISAAGSPNMIKPEMIKNEVVLIDAGTSEIGGKQVGDVDPSSYEKASYYTPVPGGIGPLTIAYLMENLVKGQRLK